MNSFHKGTAAILNKDNVDTDQIIPKQFLTSIERTGFEKALFFDWRYLDNGMPNPDFSLNKTKYRNASVLITGENFGCGSSREHAPWALQQYGFQVVIAQSFADIFYSNCMNNQILAIKLNDTQSIIEHCANSEQPICVNIDLENQTMTFEGLPVITFDIDEKNKRKLLAKMDFIAIAESFETDIYQFESQLDANGFQSHLVS
jgi:3-isopropylmalate/(R)-2-methylmalate dehydratase small subunit